MTAVAFQGRMITPRELKPWPVYGGFRAAWSWWTRDPYDGWDQEWEPVEDRIYATELDARSAIGLILARSH